MNDSRHVLAVALLVFATVLSAVYLVEAAHGLPQSEPGGASYAVGVGREDPGLYGDFAGVAVWAYAGLAALGVFVLVVVMPRVIKRDAARAAAEEGGEEWAHGVTLESYADAFWADAAVRPPPST